MPRIANLNQPPKPEKAPLTERLRPFAYRAHAQPKPPGLPDGFTPRGGCNLPHNENLYRDERYGSAQVDTLVFAGTDLHPQTVDRNKGLLPAPQEPTTRTLTAFRKDARGHNRALGGHITGHHNRGYQSSSISVSVAKDFSICRGTQVVQNGWVYSAFVRGVDVDQGRRMDKWDKQDRATTAFKQFTLPFREALSDYVTHSYDHEMEVAVPDGILRDDIVGLRKTKSEAMGWGSRFIDTVWVDPSLPDAWYNRVGLNLLNYQERRQLKL